MTPIARSRTTGQFSCHPCGRQWNALGEVHCTVCHEHFAGYEAFDLHLRGWTGGPHPAPGAQRRPKVDRPLLARSTTPLGAIWGRARSTPPA